MIFKISFILTLAFALSSLYAVTAILVPTSGQLDDGPYDPSCTPFSSLLPYPPRAETLDAVTASATLIPRSGQLDGRDVSNCTTGGVITYFIRPRDSCEL